MRTMLTSLAVLAFTAVPAVADERPVTEAERTKLAAAVAAQNCSDGKMQWDEGDKECEVDDARCSDNRKYDLKFNADYTLKSKKLDD